MVRKSKYDDIIDMPHHVSERHPPLSRASYAAQFSPFAALTGYDEMVEETARYTGERIELDEDEKALIDARLREAVAMAEAHRKAVKAAERGGAATAEAHRKAATAEAATLGEAERGGAPEAAADEAEAATSEAIGRRRADLVAAAVPVAAPAATPVAAGEAAPVVAPAFAPDAAGEAAPDAAPAATPVASPAENNIGRGIDPIAITYFKPDLYKEGGFYVTVNSFVKKYDPVARVITLADGCRISVDDIYSVELRPDGARDA